MAPKESQDDVARPAARLPGCIAASLRGWSTLTGSAAQEAPAIDFPHLEMDRAVQHVRIRAVLEFACSTSPKLAVPPPPPHWALRGVVAGQDVCPPNTDKADGTDAAHAGLGDASVYR